MRNRMINDLLDHIESRIKRDREEDETDLKKLYRKLVALKKDIDFAIDTVDVAVLLTYRNIEKE